MIVVPLVEHAVRHGLEPLPHGGRLVIRAERQAERLEVVVTQDGLAFDLAGAWLEPLRDRLLGHYGDAARLTVTSALRGGALMVEAPYELVRSMEIA
jgi:LytS/YehU family sensor histidine kinase